MADTRRPDGPGAPPRPGPLTPTKPRVFDEPARTDAEAPGTARPAPGSTTFERVRPPLVRIRAESSPEHQRREDRAAADLTGEGRIGKDDVTPEELRSMGSLVAARHLMVLLAKKRADRAQALATVGELVIGLDNPALVRRLLLELPDAGRIVDIYPLEVLAYVLERRADLLEGFELAPFVENKAELEACTLRVEEPIRIRLPLAMKLRAFALDGGGTPGYCLAPGAPGEYVLELGASGEFRLLLRGDVRKKSLVDRLILRVEDAPDSA